MSDSPATLDPTKMPGGAMTMAYKPVGWNRNKLIYDAVLLCGVVAYILLYLKLAPLLSPSVRAVDTPILRMRAFGSLAGRADFFVVIDGRVNWQR